MPEIIDLKCLDFLDFLTLKKVGIKNLTSILKRLREVFEEKIVNLLQVCEEKYYTKLTLDSL